MWFVGKTSCYDKCNHNILILQRYLRLSLFYIYKYYPFQINSRIKAHIANGAPYHTLIIPIFGTGCFCFKKHLFRLFAHRGNKNRFWHRLSKINNDWLIHLLWRFCVKECLFKQMTEKAKYFFSKLLTRYLRFAYRK